MRFRQNYFVLVTFACCCMTVLKHITWNTSDDHSVHQYRNDDQTVQKYRSDDQTVHHNKRQNFQKLQVASYASPENVDQVSQSNKTLQEIVQTSSFIACIFTTFKENQTKMTVYKNTLKNWSRFLPDIQPVLFSTNMSNHMTSVAEGYGWIVQPCPRTNEFGTPFFKDMYFKAYSLVNASLYGFANGDILFDGGLSSTLKWIADRSHMSQLDPMMVTGRRWNYKMKVGEELSELDKINKLANPKLSFHCSPIAMDYFFLSKQYPWTDMIDVVIGRPQYDNYFMSRSIQMNLSSIDASETISAIHQIDSEGTFSGLRMQDSKYNKIRVKKFNWGYGRADESWFQSQYNAAGNIILRPLKLPQNFMHRYKELMANTP